MNKVFISGRMTKDIEEKKNGVGVFTLAVSKSKDDTIFIDCVSFEKITKVIKDYSGKGKMLTVEGSLDINEWKDKDGNNRRTYQVIVNSVELPPKN